MFLIFARNLTPEFYGELISAFALANIIILFFDFGIPVLLQKNISEENENIISIANTSFSLIVYSFPVYFLLSYILFSVIYPSFPIEYNLIIIILVFLFSILNLFVRVFSAKFKFKEIFFSQLVFKFAILIFITLLLYFYQFDLYTSLIIILIGYVLQLIFLYPYVKILISNIKKFSFVNIKLMFSLLAVSLPLSLAILFNFLYDKIDIILISKLTGFSETADYGIAYGLYRSSTLVFSFIFVAAFSKFSKINELNSEIKLLFAKYFKSLVVISIVISVLLYFFSDFIIAILYSGKYSAAGYVMQVLSFAILGLSLNNLTGIVLNSMGMFKSNMYIALTALLINVILNLIFIPYFGIVAAAVISVITEYFIFMAGAFILRKIIF
ncbi:MAG TPA: oligosaccharide flippase family protein [Ignavibacteria bacterium]|nr:oligosaccharide flippase family protein [Ignavibacteria bacterium]